MKNALRAANSFYFCFYFSGQTGKELCCTH